MSGGFGNFLNKVKTGAQSAGAQAAAFAQEGTARAQSGSSNIMQGFSLPGESQKAAKILKSFLADPSHPESALNSIPKQVLLGCKGLAVFTILKAGFVFSGKAGSGLVVARLPDGSWSAPSCIATAGVGWGLQIGADLTEVVMVLNTDEAVKAFSRGGNVTIGGSVSAAAGPIGTGGQLAASIVNPSPIFSYSRSKGLFAGLSLDGTILVERSDANRAFYGANISSTDILTGRVPAPEIASPMYDVIEAAEGLDDSHLPDQSYVPSNPVGGTHAQAGAPASAPPPTGNTPLFDSEAAHKK
ncbi:SH3 domain-containing protein [Vanrija pseudolonga]|uniref:SH3 domain-containing protein n=1 Tax=Vanrija pseudolonga TaxID=143232 RepID=A0AAF1BME7_9TREE|nr:SH3 domain-containing protein [Vanrija pseudolonga]